MSGGSHANSVSEGTTRFQSLFSVFFPRVTARLVCDEDSLEHLVHMGSPAGLGNTPALPCLSSSLIRYAVDSIDVPLGLETD